MIDFDSPRPPEVEPGDALESLSPIRPGDIVCIERVGPGRVTVRALSPDEAAAFPGRTYRIERSGTTGRVRFSPVRSA